MQVTGPLEVLCAGDSTGALSSAAASTALKVMRLDFIFMKFIAVLPFEPPLMFPAGRIPQSIRWRYAGPAVVRLRPTLKSKLSEDPAR